MADSRIVEALKEKDLLFASPALLKENLTVVNFPSYTQLKRLFARWRGGEKGVVVDFDVRSWTLRLGGLNEDGMSIRLISGESVTHHSVLLRSLEIGQGIGDFTFVGFERWDDSGDCSYIRSSGVITHTVTKSGGVFMYSRQMH